jgi:hypothetical protein
MPTVNKELTTQEVVMNEETRNHISRVNHFLNKFIIELLKRGEEHDQSKLSRPEVAIFAEHTPLNDKSKPRLSQSYGTPEYESMKAKMQPALDHHYARNRHHPEYHEDSVEGMNLIDLIEMFCDWRAATERNEDGSIKRSIRINTDRYNIPPALARILENSISLLGD